MRFAPALFLLGVSACASSTGPSPVARAAFYVDKGQPEQAERVLRDHLRRHPRAIAERRLLIRVLGRRGDLAAANGEAELLARALGAARPEPWVELGHAYELAHRFDEALALYDRAAHVAPRDPLGPREGGLRAARWGELEWAAPRLEEALRRDPRDAHVWHALGLVRLQTRDVAGARRAYESGLVADPRALENHLGLATIAWLEDEPHEALVHYDALIAARPRLADAHLGRAWALFQLGRYAEAEVALDRASQLGADRRAVRAQRRRLGERLRSKESN